MSLADLYSALADPTRLRVLELLHAKARPVHELAAAFDISRPAISRHLRVLKEAGLVQEVKQGRENLYSFQRDELKPGIAWLDCHRKPPGKSRKAALVEAVAAVPEVPAPVETPIVVAEPIIMPEPIAPQVLAPEPVVAAEPAPPPAVAEAVPEAIIVKPKAPAKPRVAKPKAEAEPVAPPPPKQTPQLSFFDL
ncbi:ArsR/SmtB family transcription factor [Devosia sp. A16]|uniref:ArsR/SmtB family transcription factor n=1 Tax=Devosia sp. A16 TaxID=1736675 RepID=UPI0006D78202|nr:metalloregulator ArsR/SmtB family transcription factor [Devosia sp. A16]